MVACFTDSGPESEVSSTTVVEQNKTIILKKKNRNKTQICHVWKAVWTFSDWLNKSKRIKARRCRVILRAIFERKHSKEVRRLLVHDILVKGRPFQPFYDRSRWGEAQVQPSTGIRFQRVTIAFDITVRGNCGAAIPAREGLARKITSPNKPWSE